jgi:hypothetical protein
MTVDQNLLRGTQAREWSLQKSPSGVIPKWIYTGRDESGLGPIYVGLATVTSPPTRENMRALHAAYKGRQNFQLVVGAVSDNLIWIFGPDERAEITGPLEIGQGCRQLQSALDEPDAIAAYTRLGQFRRSLDTTSLLGVTNSGLFASYHIRENVPKRNDWNSACERSKQILNLRNEELIKALGFKSERTAGNALLLTSSTPHSKAVAILLDESEQFDASSARHTGISPVSFGLNVAARQGVSWLFLLRKDQIRIYPATDGVGVGQKGQVETYLEIDLAAIDSERAGLLTLIFSSTALEENGTTGELLKDSKLFAANLGTRLRERIYEQVVPQLAKAVANNLREQGRKLDPEGLSLAYRITLRILFRLLFQAYAEDRGLLPAGRNEGYDANSLKTIAKRIKDTSVDQFGKSKTFWLDLVQVWDAIDEGNETWNVPAYNGGLFGKNPELHPEGSLIDKLSILDEKLGPILQHLLLDFSEDNVLGPVDFRSLSVREFGTIYEGLLESSLSVAQQDLTLDSKNIWIPALKESKVLVAEGEVYFHSSSGERKASGSYFTPSVVVDHLISRSLDPALDVHLAKIKQHLDKGDQATAAREFFDFRVADLAMGSGHFLVAAVDRIEARMRTFLAEKETQVPGINSELQRLSIAAKKALGKDESAIGEIEPASLLRRQIARRCIYGLDVNPLAVELSRLAIWIHTFVPGLPMSILDHGLVCANSLTGIGTIEEALIALQPDINLAPLKKGQGRTVSFYEDVVTENLLKASTLLIEAANSDEANKTQTTATAVVLKEAKLAAEPVREIFDAAVAARIGIFDPRTIFEDATLIEVSRSKDVREAITGLKPAHLPFLFPEVFLREKPGFDVLIGNPPWEIMHIEENVWWGMHIPGYRSLSKSDQIKILHEFRNSRPDLEQQFLNDIQVIDKARKVIQAGPFPGLGSGHIDLYQAFAWRNLQLIRDSGIAAMVLPRVALSGSGLQEWRRTILAEGSFVDIANCINTAGWMFEGVDGRYSVALVVFNKKYSSEVQFSGPFSTEQDLLQNSKKSLKVDVDKFLEWSGTAAFPLIPSQECLEVFELMRNSPNFSSSHKDFSFRPVQGDLNASTAKRYFDFDLEKSKGMLPVYSGSTINIYDPNFGPPYAFSKEEPIRKFLLDKFQSASRNSSSAYFGFDYKDPRNLPIDKPRISFRNVTNQTNTRTTIVCLIPPSVIATHGIPILVRTGGSEKDEAFLLGVMSSLIFDWYSRRWVELNFTFELLNFMPIPNYNLKDERTQKLVMNTAKLAYTDKRFDEWANLCGLNEINELNQDERNELIIENDALVAHHYGLSVNQVKTIFQTFHKNWNFEEQLTKTLSYFENWT